MIYRKACSNIINIKFHEEKKNEMNIFLCIVHQVQNKIKSVTIEGFNGKVINLMSTDVAHFDYCMFYIHLLWKGPVEILVFGYFIYKEIGYYGWIGIGFILCFVPIQSR